MIRRRPPLPPAIWKGKTMMTKAMKTRQERHARWMQLFGYVPHMITGHGASYANSIDDFDKAAKWYAAGAGYAGQRGGWIYKVTSRHEDGSMRTGFAVCQGWTSFSERYTTHILDTLTRAQTAFDSFHDLCNAQGGYRPTLFCDHWQRMVLADAYDRFQMLHGDKRRVHRVAMGKSAPANELAGAFI